METDYIYVPKSKGNRKPDKVEVFIGLFTPGKEHAIKRDELTQRCVGAGLINPNAVDKDRVMRKLLTRAKVDYNIKITNDGDGEGYITCLHLKNLCSWQGTIKEKIKRQFLFFETTKAIKHYRRTTRQVG